MSDLGLSDSSSASSLIINNADAAATTMSGRRYPITSLLHWTCSLVLLGLSIYLIVLAWSNGVTLFSLHPILMGIAFLLLFPQAIALFDPDYYKSIGHKQRVKYHLICQIAGIICASIGFVAIYVNKNLTGHTHHFYTYHGLCGLIVCIMLAVIGIGGALAYYSFRLRAYIRPVLLKIYHSFGGMLVLIVGSLTVILGFYSNWYRKNGSPDLRWFIFPVIVISTLLVLRKSLYTLKDRVMSMFGHNNL